MILTRQQMMAAENAAFARGVEAEVLMDAVGAALADLVMASHAEPGVCHVFYGKGNNGGDALVAGRHLSSQGWKVELHGTAEDSELAPLAGKKLKQFRESSQSETRMHRRPCVVLDGLLGIGAKGTPSGLVADRIREIQELHRMRAWVLAIDIPSGLDCDSGVGYDPCVTADVTATIGFAKEGLVADGAADFVGRLEVVPLEGVDCTEGDPWQVAEARHLSPLLPRRAFDIHKGICGRVGLVAGSPGFCGAARLSSAGAVRSGAGLVTLFAEPETWPILSTNCFPEVMVHKTHSLRECLDFPLDTLAIGPGLGRKRDREILALIRDFPGPCVVDADALNALSADPGILRKAGGPRLLTPHPGEMERLEPCRGRTRREWATSFAATHGCTLLLKGARSLVVGPDGRGHYNTTGTPGMASGGMGDVLTGVIAGLCKQTGGDMMAAAALGMWLCGRAAELALQNGQSEESLIAGDTIENLGRAFHSLIRPDRGQGCF